MSGRNPFSELTKDFTPERRQRIDEIEIEAVGGKLKIVAEFPEDEVAITNFSDTGESEEPQSF